MSKGDVSAPTWIQKTPNVIGGDACIRNTRIAVWMLVDARNLGMSDQELLQAHPNLSQTDLDAAWEYYRGRRAEIEQAIRENEEA